MYKHKVVYGLHKWRYNGNKEQTTAQLMAARFHKYKHLFLELLFYPINIALLTPFLSVFWQKRLHGGTDIVLWGKNRGVGTW